jgi:hypothetical protein
MPSPATQFLQKFADMCRPDGAMAARWLAEASWRKIAAAVGMIVLGGASYGFSLGAWRALEMGCYVAVKLPLLLLLVTLSNGLLNGMVAQLQGAQLSFRQSLLSTLLSYAIFSITLASLAPAMLLLAFTLPEPDGPLKERVYAALLLSNIIAIAYAGIQAYRRFFPALVKITGQEALAKRVLATWLAGNLFVGAQLSYALRPFFGHPGMAPSFLSPHWRVGNFYSTAWGHAQQFLPGNSLFAVLWLLGCAYAGWKLSHKSPPKEKKPL